MSRGPRRDPGKPKDLSVAGVELGKAVKFSGVARSGGEAKALVQGGRVRVNGQVETRRGHRLAAGDRIEVEGKTFVVR
jgi:ribosome-associated protein